MAQLLPFTFTSDKMQDNKDILKPFHNLELASKLTNIMSSACVVGNSGIGENTPMYEPVFSDDDKLIFKAKIFELVKSIEKI
jgi:hypothetical protein